MAAPGATQASPASRDEALTPAGGRGRAYRPLPGLPVNDPGAEGETLRITTTRSPPGLAISGEIDETSYADLVSVLARFADWPAEIHVGLAGVEYCDLAGLRAILNLAGGNGQSRCVMLHDVPPAIKEVLRIIGWDVTPGLTIDEPPWRPARPPAREPARPGCALRAPATTRALAEGGGPDGEPGSEMT